MPFRLLPDFLEAENEEENVNREKNNEKEEKQKLKSENINILKNTLFSSPYFSLLPVHILKVSWDLYSQETGKRLFNFRLLKKQASAALWVNFPKFLPKLPMELGKDKEK